MTVQPSKPESSVASSLRERRRMRVYQANHRRSKRSYVTLYEDAVIVLAWEAGELSEGQATKALGTDRLSARERRDELIADGLKIGGTLWQANRSRK